jgi:hypothetical protein
MKTFKALAIEPDYMQESNPDGPAPLPVLLEGFYGLDFGMCMYSVA